MPGGRGGHHMGQEPLRGAVVRDSTFQNMSFKPPESGQILRPFLVAEAQRAGADGDPGRGVWVTPNGGTALEGGLACTGGSGPRVWAARTSLTRWLLAPRRRMKPGHRLSAGVGGCGSGEV